VYGRYIAFTFFISLVLSYPLGWLADWLHPLRASIGLLALYVGVTAWGGFAINGAGSFATAFILHSVLSGCFFTCSASLGLRLFPNARFAQFASAAGGLTAAGTMLLGPMLGQFLDRTGHIYRYTYLASSAIAALGLGTLLIVYAKWQRLGGMRHYEAPE